MSRRIKQIMAIAALAALVGLIIGGLGFALGGMQSVSIRSDGIKLIDQMDGAQWVSVNETYDPADINQIIVDLNTVDRLIIKRGGALTVTGQNRKFNGGLSTEAEAGVLTLSLSEEKAKGVQGFLFVGASWSKEGKSYATITLPEGMALSSIKVRLSYGDVSISDIATDALALDSSTGDINLRNIKGGSVGLDIKYGDISVSDLSATSLEIGSSTGDINLTNIEGGSVGLDIKYGDVGVSDLSTASLEIGSSTGDINLKDVKLSEQLQIDSSYGDINIKGLFHGTSTINSSTGDVNITLENNKSALSLNLDTKAGDLTVGGKAQSKPYIAAIPNAADKLTIKASYGDLNLHYK